MGHRLSKITTRTGDDGTTGLGTGDRVGKTSPRIAAIGDIDELNSLLGVALAQALPAEVSTALAPVQHELFDLGGELSMPGHEFFSEAPVMRLEAASAALNEELPPLKEFILPGGDAASAFLHLARGVARRCERVCWKLAENEDVNPHALHYLNRLSDLLFIAARVTARAVGGTELAWKKPDQR